jgi:FAD synthetase
MTKVMVFGVFDVLHPGHDLFLRKAASYGEELIVVIARDKTVKQVKGYAPLQDEMTRLKRITEHPSVTQAVFGVLGEDKTEVVFTFDPDVICLGYDQEAFIPALKKKIDEGMLDVKLERLAPFKEHIYKSSIIRKKANDEVNTN